MSWIVNAQQLPFKNVPSPLHTQCPVCLTEWKEDDRVTQLACKHLYCKKDACLERSLRSHMDRECSRELDCTVCRAELRIDEHRARRFLPQVAQIYRHLQDPGSTPPPLITQEHLEDLTQWIHLFGPAAFQQALATTEARIDREARLEKIGNRVLLAILAILLLSGLIYFTRSGTKT